MCFLVAIIITGGYNTTNYWPVTEAGHGNGEFLHTSTVELWRFDPESGKFIENCSLPDMPHTRMKHSVDRNIVCGGDNPSWTLDDCITFTGGEWKETHKLVSSRWGHFSWKVCEGVVLLGGSGSLATGKAELIESKTGKSTLLFSLERSFT